MASTHELALRIEERATGGFFWALLEACEVQGSEVFHYRPFRSASAPQFAYWDAMALGMVELRRAMAEDAVVDVGSDA